eukprot:771349-Amorphochlora_amoeboformis.AAC.3
MGFSAGRARIGVALAVIYVVVNCLYTTDHDMGEGVGLESQASATIHERPIHHRPMPAYMMPAAPVKKGDVIRKGIILGLAVAVIRMGAPRLSLRLRRAVQARRRREREDDTFAQMLNLTKAELAAAVRTGKLFESSVDEIDETLPVIIETLETCMWKVGNWTTIQEMGPADTPITKAHCAIDKLLYYEQFVDRRLKATLSSLESVSNVARELNMSGVPIDARSASDELDRVIKMVENTGWNRDCVFVCDACV